MRDKDRQLPLQMIINPFFLSPRANSPLLSRAYNIILHIHFFLSHAFCFVCVTPSGYWVHTINFAQSCLSSRNRDVCQAYRLLDLDLDLECNHRLISKTAAGAVRYITYVEKISGLVCYQLRSVAGDGV